MNRCYYFQRVISGFKTAVILGIVGQFVTGCVNLGDGDNAADAALKASKQLALKQRSESLGALQDWQIDGRISLTTDDEAWSGKLYWMQRRGSYQINFNAPSGQGALQLLGDEYGVELRLANGESYTARDTDTLLREQAGWELPIGSLWYWIRGLPDPGLPQSVQVDTEGLVQRLEQNDWVIEYDRYQQYQGYQFPRKIVVESEDMKVRLIVSRWNVS